MGMIDEMGIDSVFFDAGNTLLLLDYDAITEVIRSVSDDHPVGLASLVEPAEHRARRRVDAAYRQGGATDLGMWDRYFGYVLEELGSAGPALPDERLRILASLRAVHASNNLWRLAAPHAEPEGRAFSRGG